MRIPDFKINMTLLPTIPVGTELTWINADGIPLTSKLSLCGDWINFRSFGEFTHPLLKFKETYIDLAPGGNKIKESILRDLWLQQNGLPDKWAIRGCDELRDYYIEEGVEALAGDIHDCIYFIKYNKVWDYYTKSNFWNDFDIITFDEFKKYYKQNKKEKMEYVIKNTEAQKIIDAIDTKCYWREKLAALWSKNIVLGKHIEVEGSLYREMYEAATKEQKELLDSIFGKSKKEVDLTKFKKSSNPFILYEQTCDIPFNVSGLYKNKLWLNGTIYKFDFEKTKDCLYLVIDYK